MFIFSLPVPAASSGPFLPVLVEPHYGQDLDAGRRHEGLDLFAPLGTPLVAVRDGEVIDAEKGYSGGRGNFVSLYSAAGDRTYNYFHLQKPPLVKKGDMIVAGHMLGRLGCSGSCDGRHLHFEVRVGRNPYGRFLDPKPFLKPLPLAPQALKPTLPPELLPGYPVSSP